MTDTLHAALYSILADDRETWVTMAMAIKADRGEAGFTMWDTWSRQSDRYKAADARAVWRSVKPTGGITIATLYHMAKENGWAGQAPVMPRPTPEEIYRRQEQARREEEEARDRAAKRAVDVASKMLQEAELAPHDYLASKGFPDTQCLVLDGKLLVPMRSVASGELQSIQTIAGDGSKKFLPGGKAKGAVYRLGRGFSRWYCEGYTTGLSIQAALQCLYRRDEVVVCFSAGNLPVAASYDWWPAGYVIADHDASGTGEKYARQTGLPYWMPPEIGDANDFHQARGLDALADALRRGLYG